MASEAQLADSAAESQARHAWHLKGGDDEVELRPLHPEQRFEAILPAGLWLALGVIAVPLLALIALQAFEAASRSPQLTQNRALLTHTFEVIATAESLESAAQNSERAERAYLLTGAGGFLKSYRAEAARARQLLVTLRTLAADNPEEQHRIRILTAALEDWLAVRQQTVDEYDLHGPDAARRLVQSPEYAEHRRRNTLPIEI